MRILFTTTPARGHVQPLVPLARAALQAGHQVAFATARSLAATVEQAGCVALAAGFEPHGRCLDDIAPGLRQHAEEDVTSYFVPHLFVAFFARVMLPDLLGICRAWQPDLLVRENAEFAACVAAELLDLPCATLRASGSAPLAYANRLGLAAPLAALREYAGLAPDPDVAMPFRTLYLLAEPPSFSPHDLPPTTRRLRPLDGLAASSGRMPAWVADLLDRPTVYATLGTGLGARESGRRTLGLILAALRDEPINVILTVGEGTDPAALGPQPPHVHIERFVPHELILPACDLVLSHGGFGTVKGALAHGLPLVLVPHTADQPHNAARCAELGVGLTIAPADRACGTIRDAVRTVLADVTYRQHAQRLQSEIQALPGPEDIIPLLEDLVTTRPRVVGAQ